MPMLVRICDRPPCVDKAHRLLVIDKTKARVGLMLIRAM